MPMAELRRRAGEFLLSRVAGDDHGPRIERIWGTPGERTYGPSDPIWHVNQDPSMYTGGVCALFLQSLHPGPMAAVCQRRSNWGPFPAAEKGATGLVVSSLPVARGGRKAGWSWWCSSAGRTCPSV